MKQLKPYPFVGLALLALLLLVIMPLVGLRETPLPIPATISEPVLPGPGAPMGAASVAAPASPETKG